MLCTYLYAQFYATYKNVARGMLAFHDIKQKIGSLKTQNTQKILREMPTKIPFYTLNVFVIFT